MLYEKEEEILIKIFFFIKRVLFFFILELNHKKEKELNQNGPRGAKRWQGCVPNRSKKKRGQTHITTTRDAWAWGAGQDIWVLPQLTRLTKTNE